MIPIGTQLGHYRILNLLKRGGMGEVYKAEDTRLPRQVAIKVIQSEAMLYPDDIARQEAARLFQREMQAIAKLDHSNILSLFDFGEQINDDSHLTYMVMPLRTEGSLSDWLRRRGSADPLSAEEVGHLVRQAASGLSYAHAQGLVHQDVKPSNFLIRHRDEQPNRPDLLLADFGIAKMTGTSKSSTNVRGTLEYMAPEQLNGHATPASDQYALAIMAYELLTGRVPFSGTPSQVIFQHTQTIPTPPSTINPRVPKLLDSVILRALAKDPEKRFPSTTAFSKAFDLALQGKQVDGHPEEKTQYAPSSGPAYPHYEKTVPAFDHRDFPQEVPIPHSYAVRNTRQRSSTRRILLITVIITLLLAGGTELAFGISSNKGNSNDPQIAVGANSTTPTQPPASTPTQPPASTPTQPPASTPTPPPTLFTSGIWHGQGTYYNGQSPFDMLLTVTVSGNTFSGTLEEDTYSSVVSISGSITNSSGNNANITFTDNATVSGGQIQLNCTYTATVSNGQMSGVWYYPGDSSPDGTITLNKTV